MSILERFFTRKLQSAITFEGLHADMHSHLIPGIDDGVKDWETAVMLAENMQSLGFRKLITTPHIMADIYKNEPATIRQGVNHLNKLLQERSMDVVVEAAAEYQLDGEMTLRLEREELMTFGDNYILIELPYYSPPDFMTNIFFNLQVAGYKVILAHPERYAYWHHKFSALEDLKNRGIFFQLNTISLGGHYSGPVKKISERLIDAGMVDFLGSDLHNVLYFNMLKKCTFEPYLEKLLGSGTLKNHLL